MPDTSIERFRRGVTAASRHLEARRQEVNGLKVDEIGRDEIVQAVARAALMGARGNSGVILSQIVRGAAEELVSRPGELVDPVLVAAAFASAADAAYDSVRDPAEGTMLTVIREMAHTVAQELAHMERPRLDDDATDEQQDALLAEVLEQATRAGEEAVERTPEQLDVLAKAGVVDAGAYGIVLILSGVVAGLRGDDEALKLPHHEPARATQPPHEDSRFRYCTNFIVTGSGAEPRSFVPRLEEIGDSVLVVGDDSWCGWVARAGS